MESVLFNIFAVLAVLSALLVVVNPLSRNPVTSAMFLVTTMISISGLFVLLNAYFLAAVQILVYAGAVMVLFLFVIMLLDIQETARRKLRIVSLVMGFVAVGALFGVYKSSVEATYEKAGHEALEAAEAEEDSEVVVGSTQALGQGLFSHEDGLFCRLRSSRSCCCCDDRSNFVEQRSCDDGADLSHYLLVSGALFSIGLLGVIVRRNLLIIYMSLELMLNAANVALVAMSRFNGNLDGQVMVFFIITVAAAEVAVGLALIVALYRKRRTAEVEDLATMKLKMEFAAWLILLLPLISAVTIGIGAFRSKPISAGFPSAVVGSFILTIVMVVTGDANIHSKVSWLAIEGLSVDIGLQIDNLSKLMLCVVTGVGSLIHIFSLGYMKEDRDFSRYFAFLSLFIFSMLGIVLADNFVMILSFGSWSVFRAIC